MATLDARAGKLTMPVYLYDCHGQRLAMRACPVELQQDGTVTFTEATFPSHVLAPKGRMGMVPVAAFALHPEGHPKHQAYELPDLAEG